MLLFGFYDGSIALFAALVNTQNDYFSIFAVLYKHGGKDARGVAFSYKYGMIIVLPK